MEQSGPTFWGMIAVAGAIVLAAVKWILRRHVDRVDALEDFREQVIRDYVLKTEQMVALNEIRDMIEGMQGGSTSMQRSVLKEISENRKEAREEYRVLRQEMQSVNMRIDNFMQRASSGQ